MDEQPKGLTADELHQMAMTELDEEINKRLASALQNGVLVAYDANENHFGASLGGVPLRDLTAAEFAEYPRWLQRSVLALNFYRWA